VNATNIRLWIHDQDLLKLEKVVWEGFGLLLVKHTSGMETPLFSQPVQGFTLWNFSRAFQSKKIFRICSQVIGKIEK